MTCHLYRHYDKDGRLLYVGISLSAIARAAQHKSESSWFNQSRHMTIEVFKTTDQARDAEVIAIKKERPLFNRCHIAARFAGEATTKKNLPDFAALNKRIEQARIEKEAAIQNEFGAQMKDVEREYDLARRRVRHLRAATEALQGRAVTLEHVLWQLNKQYEADLAARLSASQDRVDVPHNEPPGIFRRLSSWLRSWGEGRHASAA